MSSPHTSNSRISSTQAIVDFIDYVEAIYIGQLCHTIDNIYNRFQNGLKMENHPRCSVKTLMHATVYQECLRHVSILNVAKLHII